MGRHPFSSRLRGITREVMDTYGTLHDPAYNLDPARRLPSRPGVVRILENLFSVLYPGFHGAQHLTRDNVEYHVGALLDDVAADERYLSTALYDFPEEGTASI